MIVGVPKETKAGETRAAMSPTAVAALVKLKLEVMVESGAGVTAGFYDAGDTAKGWKVASRSDVLSKADVLLQVVSSVAGSADLKGLKAGCLMIGFCDPLGSPK